MIITKTPYRISFFGGGSDYPEWYNKFGGSVLSTTIDKHIYITTRFLPNFFKHKYRFVWSKIENVKKINQIRHKAVKNLLKDFNVQKGLEIHYDGDLPARSGMGSSSCFVVGLTKTLHELYGNKISNMNLAKEVINFEQNKMKEVVGSQDQVAAVFGGFNKILFNKKNSIKVQRIKKNKNIIKLEKNLLLVYTRVHRTAHRIASTFVDKLTTSKRNYITELQKHVEEGERIIKSGNINDFGNLLNSSWILKKKLSSSITNKKIDELYERAMKYGALGGKLLGAGGGGFLLVYMDKKFRKNFFKNNKNIINIPFKFSDSGTQVIFKDER